jgi:predicted dinucleotide-utilizing enzyme
VHSIGKIDREIYKCITEDIRTDEVIITDERIEHIRERHPDDYERFCSYIPQIIKAPDYIIEANKENTGILLKRIKENGEEFKLVLKIAVKDDPESYKNSVISFWHIGDTTWRKTLKNKNILYRNE